MSLFDENLNNEMVEKLIKAISGEDLDYGVEEYTKEFYENKEKHSNNYFKLPIDFVNESNNPDPDYATIGASGFDLRANEDTILKSGEFKAISTGLYFDIPVGYEIQIRARSGLAFKNGVTVLNGIGTIDSDYTGEIKVILINHNKNEDFHVSKGDRIAQAVISTVLGKNLITLNKVNQLLKETERGSGGFGSTGLQ